jgi:pimeloyl-ACP methyl ester carboxylesterase
MQQTLQERFAVAEDNIQILTNRSATKENLINGFQTHLSQAGTGDTALFYFSGHGSQEPAGKEFWEIDADRQLETLVCYDSRAGKVTDLADKELRYLISQLGNNGAEVVVIIDSCHSGHASRAIEEDDSATRQTSAQTEPRALQQFVFYNDAVQQGWINNLADIPQGQHILLSACRDIELSKEKKINNQLNGIFTHALCTQLNSQTNTLSYHNLLMRVRALTHKLNRQQTPQIEAILDANTEQPFLGKDIVPIEMMASFKDGQWELNAGLIHGIHIGDEVALRDSAGNDPDFLLLIAQVSEVFAGKSILTASTNKHKTLLKDLNGLDQANGVYSSSISHRNIEKLKFSLEGDETGVLLAREALRTLSNTQHKSDFIIEVQGDALAQGVDYRLRAKDGQYTISEADNKQFRPLFEPVIGALGSYDKTSAREVLLQLEHLKRWHQKLDLESVGSANNQLDLDAVQLIIKHNNQELIDSDVNLRYDYTKDNPKPRISLEVRCNPDKAKEDVALYCALLLFDAADASVTSLLDNEAKLLPPNICSIHFKEGHDFPVQVKQQLFNNGICETEDFLKLIVSDKPFDAKLLAQQGLEIFKAGNKNTINNGTNRGANNLLNLLDQELNFAHTRSFNLHEEPVIPLWFTKTVKIITIRPPEAVDIIPNISTNITTSVRIEAHPVLSASVSISTLEDTTRSLDASRQNTNIIPPVFRDDELTPPFSFSTSRSITSDLTVLELHIDSTKDAAAGGVDSVTAEQPLVIKVNQPSQKNETILAYSYDGECYLPLGYSRKTQDKTTQIVIERLPDAIAGTDSDTADKSLFGSIKIMFQKILHDKFGLVQDPTRLAIPLFNNIQAPYEVSDYDDNSNTLIEAVEQADKILLIMHGIIGNSRSIAGFTQQALSDNKSLAQHYDCVLTFDYENLNAPIEKTAEILKQKLAHIGLDKQHNKQLDLVVHSMGGLVSRYFIEFNQGDKVVNKLIMLGTPNGGSQIAQTISTGINTFGDWANNTLAAIINGYITNGLGALAISGLVKMLKLGGKTLGQMNPESDLLQLLAKSKQTSIPYYIIAGNTDFLVANAEEDIEAKFMQRMTKKLKLLSYLQLTHWLYKAPNDIAATVDSIQHLPENWQPNTQINIIACNHLSYFDNEQVLGLLEKILIKKT